MTEPREYSTELLAAAVQLGQERFYFDPDLFRDDDVFVASYPRSGNHFVSFLIISALHHAEHGTLPSDCSGVGRVIPGIHSGDISTASTRPRFIKTHFQYDPRCRNVIHLLRDPRDVLVSYWHYTRHTPQLLPPVAREDTSMMRFVECFVAGSVWPGALPVHTESFERARPATRYLQLCYERLATEPRREIPALLNYLGLPWYNRLVDRLAVHCGFDNMARLHDPAERGQFQMVRRGVIGGHRDELDARMRRVVESAWADYLERYGYH